MVKVTEKLFPRKLSWEHLPEIESHNRNTRYPLDSQIKYTRFQGHEVIKVKVRHDLKMTLTAKFVEHSHVVARFKALGF